MAVGDAGGIVKATTGGGIYYSLLSASLAVAAIEQAFRRACSSDDWDAIAEVATEAGGEIRAQQRLRDWRTR